MTLLEWNQANNDAAYQYLMAACGSRRWVAQMVAARPIENMQQLISLGEHIWQTSEEADWLEAFAVHPQIGQVKATQSNALDSEFSSQEQQQIEGATSNILDTLAKANRTYQTQNGFIFIICATGKSPDFMLSSLMQRLKNSRSEELNIAAEEQIKITKLRLVKLFSSETS